MPKGRPPRELIKAFSRSEKFCSGTPFYYGVRQGEGPSDPERQQVRNRHPEPIDMDEPRRRKEVDIQNQEKADPKDPFDHPCNVQTCPIREPQPFMILTDLFETLPPCSIPVPTRATSCPEPDRQGLFRHYHRTVMVSLLAQRGDFIVERLPFTHSMPCAWTAVPVPNANRNNNNEVMIIFMVSLPLCG